MTKRLTGLPSLAYTGVEASQPANSVQFPRAPNGNDYYEYNIGDYWLDISGLFLTPKVLPDVTNLWVLVSKTNYVATWRNFASGANALLSLTGNTGGPVFGDANHNINVVGDGVDITIAGVPGTHTLTASLVNGHAITKLQASDGTQAVPVAGIIIFPDQVIAGAGTVNSNLQSNVNPNLGQNFTINLKPSIIQPQTNVSGTQGVYALGSTSYATDRFLHMAGGFSNAFGGYQSGNLGLTAGVAIADTGFGHLTLNKVTTGFNNTAIGYHGLANMTTGTANTCVGSDSLLSLTTGSNNQAFGFGALINLTTGSNNVVLGGSAGQLYTGAESNNLILWNDGVNGESNTLRIGTSGGGVDQQNRCFIAGIRGITTGVNDAIAVLIDSAGQLGTVSSSARYKENIQDMGEQSKVIMDLRPVTFNYKVYPKAPSWGLIAEEVAKVFPQLATYNEELEPESVKYHDLIPLLLNEVQKLNHRVNFLESLLLEEEEDEYDA